MLLGYVAHAIITAIESVAPVLVRIVATTNTMFWYPSDNITNFKKIAVCYKNFYKKY